MDARFVPVAFAEIEVAVRRHLAALPSVIDSFLEDHILASTHYRIEVAGEVAGFASIHGESLITQFALTEPYQRYGQPIFAQRRRLEQACAAFVPTCDEFFLAHALDDYRELAKQAYFFSTPATVEANPETPCGLRPAELNDAAFIRHHSGDFCEPVERRIAAGELFVTLRHEEPVGFGLLVESRLYDGVTSIGMYTIERFRREGVGTATITQLIVECRRRGLRPVAGCGYYNHRSKRTLERAGMFSATRLFKVKY
jgi:GNAT superfamily N-acetyltransferase